MNRNNLDIVTGVIQKSMAQLVHVENHKIKPLGSAIFVKLGNQLRLLSAGHLINEKDYDKILLPLPGIQESLYIDTFGDLHTTNTEGDQENNAIDFAEIKFIRMDKIERVCNFYTPIPENKIEFNHEIIENDDRYFIFGYPNSKTRFDFKYKKEMNSAPLRIVTHPIFDDIIYEKYGYSKKTHILLKYKRKLFDGLFRFFLPKTKGISGSGVYFLPDIKSQSKSQEFTLIGILTEIDYEKQFAVVVRMETIYNIQ